MQSAHVLHTANQQSICGTDQRDDQAFLPGCSPEHRIFRLRQVRHLFKPEKGAVRFFGLKIRRHGESEKTHAALTRRRLVWGNPSVETKRICFGGGITPPPVLGGEWWLIASLSSSVITAHWALVLGLRHGLNGAGGSDSVGARESQGRRRSRAGRLGGLWRGEISREKNPWTIDEAQTKMDKTGECRKNERRGETMVRVNWQHRESPGTKS